MEEKKELIRDYTEGPVLRQLLGFAWPFMLSYMLQTLYNMVDMVVVGRFVGSVGLSAVSVGADLMSLYTFIAFGFCNAGQILISQFIGLRDRASVGRVVAAMIKVVAVSAVVITAVGMVCAQTFLQWLQVPEEAAEQCLAYTRCCTAGCLFVFGYNMVCAILRGMGDSKRPMLFIGVAAVVNIVLDIVFVSQGMGAFGAALATVIGQGVSFVWAVIFLLRNRGRLGYELNARTFRESGRVLGSVLKLGFPLVLQNVAVTVSTLVVVGYVNSYGLTASAVTGVGNKLTTLVLVVTIGMMQATNTFVGQNFAARRFERVRKVLADTLGITMIMAAILSVIMLAAPEWVFGLFTDDEAVIAMSGVYAPVAVLNFVGAAVRSPATSLCNGMGFVRMNLILGLLDGVVMRIGLCLLLGLGLGLGVPGFWYGSAAASFVYFVVMFPYFLSGRWKNRQPPAAACA